MKLLKTFRADPSDTAVFDRAAEAGEWAVSGAFAYARTDIATLPAKVRSGFRLGFLGLSSLGRSTLVQVVTATAEDEQGAVQSLARQLLEHFGAPDARTARRAAEKEMAFARDLARQPLGRLLAVQRQIEGGNVREVYRVLSPPTHHGPLQIVCEAESGDGSA